MLTDKSNEIFSVPARRCKRCGGLLTSEKALKDGYGHTCKMKTREEERAAIPDPNQITLLSLCDLKDDNDIMP